MSLRIDFIERASARRYLKSVVFPIIEDVAKKENVPLERQVSNMIHRGDTLGSYAGKPKYRKKIDEVFSHPGVRFLLNQFKDQLNTSESEIRSSMPWWMERIKETKPELNRVIAKEPKGQEWLAQIFIDVINLCKGCLV